MNRSFHPETGDFQEAIIKKFLLKVKDQSEFNWQPPEMYTPEIISNEFFKPIVSSNEYPHPCGEFEFDFDKQLEKLV